MSNNQSKQIVDVTLNDIGNSIKETWDEFSVEETWKSISDNTSDAVDSVCSTSLRDIGNACESAWDSVCSWFKSDEIELVEGDYVIEEE